MRENIYTAKFLTSHSLAHWQGRLRHERQEIREVHLFLSGNSRRLLARHRNENVVYWSKLLYMEIALGVCLYRRLGTKKERKSVSVTIFPVNRATPVLCIVS